MRGPGNRFLLWLMETAVGFIAGVVAMMAVTELTRLMRLLSAPDNWGLLVLDFQQAAVWGLVSAIVYGALRTTWPASSKSLVIAVITVVALAAVGICLIVVQRLNGVLNDEVVRAFIPLMFVGPITAYLALYASGTLSRRQTEVT